MTTELPRKGKEAGKRWEDESGDEVSRVLLVLLYILTLLKCSI